MLLLQQRISTLLVASDVPHNSCIDEGDSFTRTPFLSDFMYCVILYLNKNATSEKHTTKLSLHHRNYLLILANSIKSSVKSHCHCLPKVCSHLLQP